MTSPTDDEQHSELPIDPDDETAVRRLLAEARTTGPVPPAVADRLDASLAALVAERADQLPDESPVAAVVPLAGRRRRTVSLLVAAAAVVVGGVAVGGIIADDRGSSMDDSGASGTAVDRADEEADAGDAAPSESRTGDDMTASSADDDPEIKVRPDSRAPRVRSAHLMADIVALKGRLLRPATTPDYGAAELLTGPAFPCGDARWGKGVLVGVRYDGRPAVIAFRAPRGDSQVVEVLQCGTGDVLRSTTIASR